MLNDLRVFFLKKEKAAKGTHHTFISGKHLLSDLEVILGKIKQKQRVVFSICIGVDLVHLLNEFLKIGPAFGNVIVSKMGIVYLNPLQNRDVCNIHLKRNNVLEHELKTNNISGGNAV